MKKDELLKQHVDSYRQALIDLVKNNTDNLVDQDILSVLKKPPLDSMDNLRIKLLDLAKKNKTILNTQELDSILDKYRLYIIDCCDEIRNVRINNICAIIDKFKINVESETIKINKKDFVDTNKRIKNILKDKISEGFKVCLLDSINKIFSESIDDSIKEVIIVDLSKYLKNYQKGLLENCELKIMVKDTTLMNGVKEQGERYLFTLKHSRLLNDVDA